MMLKNNSYHLTVPYKYLKWLCFRWICIVVLVIIFTTLAGRIWMPDKLPVHVIVQTVFSDWQSDVTDDMANYMSSTDAKVENEFIFVDRSKRPRLMLNDFRNQNFSQTIHNMTAKVFLSGDHMRSKRLVVEKDLKRYLKIEKHSFNCDKLINGDQDEMNKTYTFLQQNNFHFPHIQDKTFMKLTKNCSMFQKVLGYSKKVDMKNDKIHLAFNIIMHEHADQFERLLRALYRPYHSYCVHVDRKSAVELHRAVASIAKCFPNVFVINQPKTVIYRSFKRLLADIMCMEKHVQNGGQWKYILNLAATEFPLQTEQQMTAILRVLNGANHIHETFKTMDVNRFKYKYVAFNGTKNNEARIMRTHKAKEKPPFNLTITKGNAYNIFSRAFVEFVLTDTKAEALLEWSRDTFSPDEHYWATLNNLYHNPHLDTPGGCKGEPDSQLFTARFIDWRTSGLCRGKYVRNVCLFGVGDLPRLSNRRELIANKFNIGYDPISYSCMEELLRNRTRDGADIDIKAYHRRFGKMQ